MSGLDARRLARAGHLKKGQQTVAVLDLGGTKTICLIAKCDPADPNAFTLLGAGHQSSRGIKNGAVIDMEGLERSIRLAVEDAEREAGEAISSVYVAVSSARITCDPVRAEIDTNGQELSPRHMEKVVQAATGQFDPSNRELLHALPAGFAIDGNDGVRDPRGMFAERLGVTVNMVSMPSAAFKNLMTCVSRAHLDIEGVAAAPLVSALSVLVDDEIDNGAICIDMGGSSTGFSVHVAGGVSDLGCLPVGGAHVTSDMAQGLGTTFPAAERIKTLSGSVLRTSDDGREMVDAPRIGDDGRLQGSKVARKDLIDVIEPRLEETFEMLAKRLDESPAARNMPRRAVLTGGASQLPGVRELAARTLGIPVRLGRPIRAENLGESYAKATFSTASGLLDWALKGDRERAMAGGAFRTDEAQQHGMVGRAIGWLKDNF